MGQLTLERHLESNQNKTGAMKNAEMPSHRWTKYSDVIVRPCPTSFNFFEIGWTYRFHHTLVGFAGINMTRMRQKKKMETIRVKPDAKWKRDLSKLKTEFRFGFALFFPSPGFFEGVWLIGVLCHLKCRQHADGQPNRKWMKFRLWLAFQKCFVYVFYQTRAS